jgi:hypothetical protein
MEKTNSDYVISLIKAIQKIDDKDRNESQNSLLQALKTDDATFENINVLLSNSAIYEHLGLDDETTKLVFKLDEKEWEIVKKAFVQKEKASDKSTTSSTEKLNILYYKARLTEDGKDIIITLKKLKSAAPDRLLLFSHSVQKIISTIKNLYTDDNEIKTLMIQLNGIVSIGVTSTYYELAKVQLDNFKKDIISTKGGEIKNEYLKNLGSYGIRIISGLLIILVIFGIACQDLLSTFADNQETPTFINTNVFNIDLIMFRNCMDALLGSIVGVWLSFAIQKRVLTFEELQILHNNKQNPLIRLIIILLITFVFFVMFTTNFFNIEIASAINTKNTFKPEEAGLALLVGLLIGLAEKNIASKLTAQVDAFVGKIK